MLFRAVLVTSGPMKTTPIARLILLGLSVLLGFSNLAIAEETVEPPSFIGTWEGPLVLNSDEETNLALTFSYSEGEYTATLINPGMGVYGMPVDIVRLRGLNLTIRLQRLDLEILGTLRMDETGKKIQHIDGSWYQGSEMVPIKLLPVDAPSA